MIRVIPAPEPPSFDTKVRQPGYRAIAERTGMPSDRVNGQRYEKVADRPEDIPSGQFPALWREAIPDLLTGYNRLCAYLCVHITAGVGAPSVDHMRPKSTHWDRVYEWDNYRLACSQMNANKGARDTILDPFEIEDDWFELELVTFQVFPRANLPPDTASSVRATIDGLKLNDAAYCDLREKFVVDYENNDISLNYLTRHAPFVAGELRRQSRLLEKDT